MENYLKIRKIVDIEVPLSRALTQEEIELVKEESIFELPDGVVDWDKEDVTDEDYSYTTIYNNNRVVYKF